MTRLDCVSDEHLRAFLLGDLPDRVAGVVAAHLETCAECEASARRLDDITDSMILSLQRVLAPYGDHDPAAPRAPASCLSTVTEGKPAAPRSNEGGEFPRRCIGEYELLEELGRGGMGVVYKARQPFPNRLVALKTILGGGFADPSRRARFLAEGDAIARLHHPNIVQIHEIGQFEGVPFLVLEYVAGGSLASRLKGVPQPPRHAAELVETLARAVQHAHNHGVVHRDLKPANILLGDENQPKITDFGLARHERPELTATGEVLGTPSYMAPEQALGGSGVAGPAADIYALGAILYECLTGRPPFQAATPLETLEQVNAQQPVAPAQLHAKTPRNLNTICLKCLEKDPSRRYAQAEELADDLRRFLRGEVIQARPVGLTERGWRWCRRKPAIAALLMFAAVLMLITVGVSTLSAWRLGIEAERARRAERDATRELFRATFLQAQAMRKSGEMGQRFESLVTLEKAVAQARSLGVLNEHLLDLRNEVVACLTLTDLRSAAEWERPPSRKDPGGVAIAFDGDLSHYSCVEPSAQIVVFATKGGREIVRIPAPQGQVRMVHHRLASNRRFLAAVYHFADDQFQFILWDLRADRPTPKIGPLAGVGCYALQEDGRRLAVSQPDGTLTVYDLEQDRQRDVPNLQCDVVAFRPDGQQLAFNTHTERFRVQILDLETATVVHQLSYPDDVKNLAWSANGRLLAVGCDDRNVHVWATDGWKLKSILEGHKSWIQGLMFSPVGELLASSGLDETTRLWDPISGRQLVSAPGKCLGFGANGRQLAYARGSHLGIWDLAGGRECRILHHGRVGNRAPWRSFKGPQMLDFSPNGQLMLSAAPDGVRLWTTADGREVGHLHAGHHEAARFGPDGAVYTFGRTGLRCWPVREDRGPGTLRIGPPQLLAAREGQGWFRGAMSHAGLVVASYHVDDSKDRVVIFPAERPTDRTVLGDETKVHTLAVSPDGAWVAAGVYEPKLGVQVWSTATNQEVKFLEGEQNSIAFSPDGEHLAAVGVAGYRIWKVGSWEPCALATWDQRLNWSGSPAYGLDGRILAIPRSLHQIELADTSTLQAIASLAAPDDACVSWPCFSRDGALLATATESHGIHLWDFGDIGRRLHAMGLGCATLPDAAALASAAPRVRVYQELFEAEHLPIVAEFQAGTHSQDMRRWGEYWSNDGELHGACQKGGFIELQVDAPETERYRLDICLTRSWDFGILEVTLDGQKIGQRFDGFFEPFIPAEKVSFGTFDLHEGSHRLRFTAVDRNAKSPGYQMGIDYVQLTPEPAPH